MTRVCQWGHSPKPRHTLTYTKEMPISSHVPLPKRRAILSMRLACPRPPRLPHKAQPYPLPFPDPTWLSFPSPPTQLLVRSSPSPAPY